MIHRLKLKDAISFYEFILRCKDVYEDFYVTSNKERKFFTDLKLIKKILKYQEVYAVEEKEIKALLLIYREKNYRPYVKILAEKIDCVYDLLKYVEWNINKEIFIKIKKINPIAKILQRKRNWQFVGDRGQEVLYVKKVRLEQEKKDDYNNRKIT